MGERAVARSRERHEGGLVQKAGARAHGLAAAIRRAKARLCEARTGANFSTPLSLSNIDGLRSNRAFLSVLCVRGPWPPRELVVVASNTTIATSRISIGCGAWEAEVNVGDRR